MALYNRYIHNGSGYTRIPEEDAPPLQPPRPAGPSSAPEEPPKEEENTAPLTRLAEKSGLGGLLKSLKLDKLDTGDILLLLILLFLFLEGDDMELIITLGLLLLLGLD